MSAACWAAPPAQPRPRPSDRALIEFLAPPELFDRLAKPAPASRFLPDWFRALPRTLDQPMAADADGKTPSDLPGLTVKACLPVADAFGLGQIIPIPIDIILEVVEDGTPMGAGWDQGLGFQALSTHIPAQLGAPAPPFARTVPLKFMNPWRIRVPDGVSCLFVQPLNHAELPFEVFAGTVDCDRFAAPVNIPFRWRGGPGRHHLAAGTPMVQVIPYRRDGLIDTVAARPATPDEQAEQAAALAEKYREAGTYAKTHRAR